MAADIFADVRSEAHLDIQVASVRMNPPAAGPSTGPDFLDPDTASPYLPGESPHRVKGSAFLGLFRLSKLAMGDRGPERVIARLGDPALERFFDRPIDAKQWEDVYPFFAYGRQLAAAIYVPYPQFLIYSARRAARTDIKAPLRFGLRMVSNQTIVSTMQTMGTAYWQFLRYSTDLESPKRLRIQVIGLPYILRHCLLLIGAEYNAEVLRLSGAKSASFSVGDFDALGGSVDAKLVGNGTYYLEW